MSGTLERKMNKQVLRQMRVNMDKAHEKYLKNHGNDEADWQDFLFKQEAFKTYEEELGK